MMNGNLRHSPGAYEQPTAHIKFIGNKLHQRWDVRSSDGTHTVEWRPVRSEESVDRGVHERDKREIQEREMVKLEVEELESAIDLLAVHGRFSTAALLSKHLNERRGDAA